jgi:hypothetical protein
MKNRVFAVAAFCTFIMPLFAGAQTTRTLSTGPARVTLDYQRREMVIETRLTSLGKTRPVKVWVWAFFVNPAEGIDGSRSDQSIEVGVDWKGRDTVTVTARGPFHWSTRNDIPRTGFLARVYASDISAEAAQVRSSLRDRTPKDMIRVVSKK